jgi:hypothetical protein
LLDQPGVSVALWGTRRAEQITPVENMAPLRLRHVGNQPDPFCASCIARDFLNTRPVLNGEPELLSDFSALLRWFRAAELLGRREVANFQQHWEDAPAER